MAKICNTPAALIMRVSGPNIEVFVTSDSKGNPYEAGHSETLKGSGLYCEWVVTNKKPLLIPNALKDKRWNTNPDIKLNMVSYFGLPITWPDGEVFGTICVLDEKENAYDKQKHELIEQFRTLVESSLKALYLQNERDKLSAILDQLQEIYPICCYCKSIKDENGEWKSVESYIDSLTGQSASHGICPTCKARAWKDAK